MARAVHAALGAVKVNYALLGNQLSHVHWHVIPRLPGDPAPRDTVWSVPHAPVALDAEALAGRIALIRTHLMAPGPFRAEPASHR